MKNNSPWKQTNQWADLNDPQSPDAIEIRKELAVSPSIGFERMAQVESYAEDVLGKVCNMRVRWTVELVIGDFTCHSNKSCALFDEIGTFYQDHGIPEEKIEWFIVKEVMRILLASAYGRKFDVRRRMLARYEFENARVYRAEY